MSMLVKLFAREVLDSRGYPTIEVEGSTEDFTARSIVPSGASTGSHEAHELRDGDASRYLGKGVLQAVNNVAEIAGKLLGTSVHDQRELDTLMCQLDNTHNKSRLGANAILGVSLTLMKLSAMEKGIALYERVEELAEENNVAMTEEAVLPVPMMNIINGGKHADSGLAVQECMIVPTGAATFKEALQMGAEVFHHLKKILTARGEVVSVGDEGGFAPKLPTVPDALRVIREAVHSAGHAGKISLALDAAASEFYENGLYSIDGKELSSAQLVEYYEGLCKDFPIVSIEDSHAEDDWEGWKVMTEKLGESVQLVGDDLFVTNKERLALGIEKGAANAILIKLNQIGTVTETLETIALAVDHGMNCVISHRSGETEDTTISDFAVGVSSGQIKTGSLCRSERVAKYNQLLRIEEELGDDAQYGR